MGSKTTNPAVLPRQNPIEVLLVESDKSYGDYVSAELRRARRARFEVQRVADLAAATAALLAQPPQVMLLDISAGGSTALDGMRTLRNLAPDLPVIVLSDVDGETLAVQALEEGAEDYLFKGQVNRPLLGRAILYALERKRSESALRVAERKYHSLFDHIVEGIFRTTPEGEYLDANPALARLYGYDSPEELKSWVRDIGRSLYVEPGRRKEFVGLMEDNDVVTGFESPVRRKDGSVIWISENVRAIRDGRGHLVCYEGTVEDITQRKLAQENLRDSEALYHSLVENLPQNIFRKDLNERFTFANQRFCQTLGRPLDEILGKTDFDYFPPELAEQYQRDDRRIIASGQPFETVEENRPPGGGVFYVQVVKTPLYDSRGQCIGLQGIFWDITERKIAEERVQMANAELARSQGELQRQNEQMEEDLRMARGIQQAILPQQYPVFPRGVAPDRSALQFAHRYRPAETVSGDFFHLLALSDTSAAILICDVMGHGVRSALITAMIRALVEELSPKHPDPGALLTELNRSLRAILRDSGMFTTAFYAVADLAAGVLRHSNAGHPKQLLARRRTGTVEWLASGDGVAHPPLGLMEQTLYTTSTCALVPADMILLHTDGVFDVEVANEEIYSQEDLRADVRARMHLPAARLLDELLAQVRSRSATRTFDDDVCLVGVDVLRLLAESGPAPDGG